MSGNTQVEPAPSVLDALCDDLNTPKAIAELRGLYARRDHDARASADLLQSCEFLGLLNRDKLRFYNQLHRGTNLPIPTPRVQHELNELQTAVLNGVEDRVAEIQSRLLTNGVTAKVDAFGAIAYSISHDKFGNHVRELIKARNAARKAKNFKEADRIRDELEAQGIVLKDGPEGTTWEVKR